ncbi:MAG TPA: iron-sulfur cluster repair di-iron protein [Bryobacteraceae bacterium]|jgi:regulator of cell morphogenesis and NO signaling
MKVAQEKTVGEIAAENPTSVRVFESLGIDYCCGGKRSLADACSQTGLGVADLLKRLEEAAGNARETVAEGWNEAPLARLIAHIVDHHHAHVRNETPRLETMLSKVVGRHGEKHPEVRKIRRLFAVLIEELTTHMLKEEQILFPYIEKMEQATDTGKPIPPAFFGSVARPVAHMVADHDDAASLLESIRSEANNYVPPADACGTFRALYAGLEEFERDLKRHVHLENNILFPRATKLEQIHDRAA